MKAKVFIQKDGVEYRVGFMIGVQTFHLNMGSNGLRPKPEAAMHAKMLKNALNNLKNDKTSTEE